MTYTATDDQLQALKVFAQTHGRTWKAALKGYWIGGGWPRQDSVDFEISALQQVRNAPARSDSWLAAFKLPK